MFFKRLFTKMNKILAIDTSCDETAAAVVSGRRVLANIIYSQVLLHQKWGGVVPSIAKRAHQERIDWVIKKTLKKYSWSDINFIAVTQGPGLAPALEVGIKRAKELAQKFNKKLISVNHLEGHIYSVFVQNSKGKPLINFQFPYLVLIVSGGHTSLVIFKDHLSYQIIGETIDDAAGEALDKAAKLLNLGYPGGPVIEKLAREVDNKDFYFFPRPMIRSTDLNFSFSGLKTAFYYFIKKMPEKEKNKSIRQLLSSFQEAVFDTLVRKTKQAVGLTKINRLVLVGGVSANFYLRKKFRQLAREINGQVFFPPYKYLTGDNAAMIGVVGYYKALKNQFVKRLTYLDREPRMAL